MTESSRSTAEEPATGAPAEGSPAAGESVWASIRAALRGEARDFTTGSIARAAFVLAVPMVLEMLMESLFAVVDTWFVARLGESAVAVVGLNQSLITVVFAVAIGLSMAIAAMVARRIGEKKPELASRAAGQAIVLGVLVSLPIAGIGVAWSEELLVLMGASAETAAEGALFNAIMLGSNATILLLFLVNAIFRGAGDPGLALRSLWLANLLNMLLDPILIFGWGPIPALGLPGAAVATAIGRGTGVAYQLVLLWRGSGRVRVRWAELRPHADTLVRLLRVAWTGILQFLIETASWIALVRILAVFGDTVLAGYTIAVRLIIFVMLPAWGIANATTTLVGQNLGAGQPERAERSVWITGFGNAAFLTVVGALFVLAAGWLMGLFTGDPGIVGVGVECLVAVSLSYPFLAYGWTFQHAFNGAGDTVTPTLLNLLCFWILQLPLAWWLAMGLDLGPLGVFVAISVAQAALAVTGWLAFRRGTWKATVI